MSNDGTEPSFSLHDFRRWLEEHEPKPAPRRGGERHAEARLGERRLASKVIDANPDIEEAHAETAAKAFIAEGAEVLGVDDGVCRLRLADGREFDLPKIYVRVARQEG